MQHTQKLESKNCRERFEASFLASAMAIVGGPLLFDRLGILIRNSISSFQLVLHSSPWVIALLAVCVLLMLYWVATAGGSAAHTQEGQHEL